MQSALYHPVLPFAIGAALMPFVGVQLRRTLSLLAPIVSLVLLAMLPLGTSLSVEMLGLEVNFLRYDELSRIFAIAFVLYAVVAGIFAWTDVQRGPKTAALWLAGAGTGVVLAGDLYSLFFFWEWLTITSLFLIWYGQTPGSWAAGFRYLMFHIAGAMVMLMGILLHMGGGGDPSFGQLPAGTPAGWLILLGMMTNAAVPPLHAWLSDAYPRASIYGTVFLAAFTTKSAVYALTRGFAGYEPLAWIGVVMAIFGVVYAVLENDIRRLLSYHIISQVGYMVAGVGLGTGLALNGTSVHAFAHIFYKGLLMMSAGAVIYATGRGKLTELGQLAGAMKWTLILMLIGAFSISGVPYFNGYVSKSIIVSAAGGAGQSSIQFLLLLVGMGTFLSVGLKLPYFTFFGHHDNGARVARPVPMTMYIGMGMAALLCIVTGIVPGPTLYAILPFAETYNPFTGHHFVESMQLLVGTTLGFWLLRVKLVSKPATTVDIDFLYRQPLLWVIGATGGALETMGERVSSTLSNGVSRGWDGLQRLQQRSLQATVAAQGTVVFVGMAIAIYLGFLFTR